MPPEIRFESLPELTTPRFRLRLPAPTDAERLHEIYSNPGLMRFIAHAAAKSAAEMRGRLEGHVLEVKRHEAARWMVESKADGGRVIGYVALFRWSQLHQVAEVGYAIAHEWWSKKVMAEILPALLKFGFEEMALQRIEAMVDAENAASLRVLERDGFLREGVLRERSGTPDGRRTDAIYLGLLKSEYQAGTRARTQSP